MFSPVEVRERLVELLHADLVQVSEIPKGKQDYKPSGVLFFWSVNWLNAMNIVIDRTYHATHNVLVRLNHELEENAALLQKSEEVCVFDGEVNLQQRARFTSDEQAKANWLKEIQERMEDTIVSLDETLFLLTDPTDKGKLSTYQ